MAIYFQLGLLFGISILLSFSSLGRKILFPFQLFTTWIHECCHALMAMLLGGSAIKITISPDGGGLTHYRIPSGRIRNALVASSGYLGASFFGCVLLFWSLNAHRLPPHYSARHSILFLCVLIGLSLIFWIRNGFGFLCTFLLGLGLAALYFPPLNQIAKPILMFISVQTALNALFDIRVLFSLGNSKKIMSDAHTLQKLFFLPYWFWAFLWLGTSGFMLYWTLCKL